MRTGAYLNASIALAVSISVILAVTVVYVLWNAHSLTVEMSWHRDTYTTEAIAVERNRIFTAGGHILAVLPLSLPFHLLTLIASLIGTLPPTRRLLAEPVAEGLRKDTD